jgi:4-diphosphocytidyl-2-C-methyl-D-erythritol kinase
MSAAATGVVRVRACAKINLTLRVLGIRPDGYHELRTTFQSLALHDTIRLVRARGPFVITSNDPGCPLDPSNLVWKAASRLWEAANRRGSLAGVQVHIQKRIPMEAGLGGGSADAAAMIRGLCHLWRLRLADAVVETVARQLGADVPYFLEGGTVLGVERGDLLFPLLDAPRAWVVLARPDFGISTRDAYGWWDAAFSGPTGPTAQRSRAGEWVNDLQAPVVARQPRIGRLIRTLERAGARFAAMSGSGSAVFGLFDAREAAESAAARLASPRVTTWVTRTLNRREYLRVSAPESAPR